MTKNFAILRVKRLKTNADLNGATLHGRRQDSGTHYDPARTLYNEHYAAGRCASAPDWAEFVQCALSRSGATVRKGASVAAEFFIGASPEFFAPRDGEDHFNMENVYKFRDAVLSAFYERYGQNVVVARLDLDEGTPHMTLCVLPTYEKVTKHKRELVVSYKKVFAGDSLLEAREKLTELQDWIAEKLAPLGLSRGVPKSISHREHLSHHQYARRRRMEDEARQERLMESERLVQETERSREALEHQRNLHMVYLRKAAGIVADAEHAHDWLQRIVANLATKVPDDPYLEALLAAAPSFKKNKDAVSDLRRQLLDETENAQTVSSDTPIGTRGSESDNRTQIDQFSEPSHSHPFGDLRPR